MISFRRLIRAVAMVPAAALGTVGADAADLPDFGYAPPPVVQEFGSNWYLRGDIGYAFAGTPKVSVGNYDAAPYPLTDVSLDDSWTIGGGFGVRATEWLRLDATADYRAEANFVGYSYPLTFSGGFESWTLLANAYLDLGTWSGVTPYVGAGIGAMSLVPQNVNDGFVRPDFDYQWSFAWAVMAGASVDIAPNWSLDFGYRYVAADDFRFRDRVDNTLVVKDVSYQEVRIGARYLID